MQDRLWLFPLSTTASQHVNLYPAAAVPSADPHDPQLREQVSRLEAKLEQALALLQEMACRTLTPAGS